MTTLIRATGPSASSATANQTLAITTLWDGSVPHECALPLWCQKASKLARRIPRPWLSHVVVLTPNSSRECPSATFVWHQANVVASEQWVEHLGLSAKAGSWAYLRNAVMLKWQAFALTQFDVVLFADIDVDVSPTRAAGLAVQPAYLAALLSAFLSSPPLIAASPDHASPINTGVLLLKPRKWVYQAALQLMRHGSWDKRGGFDGAGTPSSLFSHRPALLAQLEAGLGLERAGGAARLLNATYMMQHDTWAFVAGNLDQGMFWHLLYHVHGVGTWAKARARWNVDHFWGPGKPWLKNGYAMNNYLKRLVLPASPRTPCDAYLAGRVATLQKAQKWAKDDSPGWTPYRQAVAPAIPFRSRGLLPRLPA